MNIVAYLTQNYILESKFDYVGLWHVAPRVAQKLKSTDQKEVQGVTLQIARNLIRADIKSGEFHQGEFLFWPGSEDELIARIKTEWDAMGRMPELGETICWFAPPPEVWAAANAAQAGQPPR